MPKDIKELDVTKFPLEQLYEYRDRYTSLLKHPSMLKRLPDKGAQVLEASAKVNSEIEFRKALLVTSEKMEKLDINIISEFETASVIKDIHAEKLCAKDKKPFPRFIPNANKSDNSEKQAKLIDLPQSLTLQGDQEKRTKAVKDKGSLMTELEVEEEEEEQSSDENEEPGPTRLEYRNNQERDSDDEESASPKHSDEEREPDI